MRVALLTASALVVLGTGSCLVTDPIDFEDTDFPPIVMRQRPVEPLRVLTLEDGCMEFEVWISDENAEQPLEVRWFVDGGLVDSREARADQDAGSPGDPLRPGDRPVLWPEGLVRSARWCWDTDESLWPEGRLCRRVEVVVATRFVGPTGAGTRNEEAKGGTSWFVFRSETPAESISVARCTEAPSVEGG